MKPVLGIIATLIAFYSYIPYFRDIFRGKTKPHAFSWLVWFLLTAIGFTAQISDGGGAGTWATGFTALVAFFIFLTAIKHGEKEITKSDWACLIGAFFAIGVWVFTETPLLSVILITIIDVLGFIPTFRKAFKRPHEETLQTYALSALKFAIAIVALSNYSAVTMLYPASLVVMNSLFVIMLMTRRRQKTGSIEVLPA